MTTSSHFPTSPLFESPFEAHLAGFNPEIVDPRDMQGTPNLDVLFWDGQQHHPDTCAIRCQEFILQQFTGMDIPEDQLVVEAQQHGWYRPGGGTPACDVGNLLELHGIPVNHFQHSNIFHLTNELAQGHKVIIGVDSGELWESNSILESISDALGLEAADHAVVVSGIDTSDPEHPMVIISDPGTGDAAARYPLEQFLDAWSDGGFEMVSTAVPAPSHLPEMQNFDYATGHLASVLGVSYDDFLSYGATPEAWEEHVDYYVADADHETAVPDGDVVPHQESAFLGETLASSAEHFLSDVLHLPIGELLGGGGE
ncbi:MAG: hypothetical protein ACKV2Q_24475 [Planctomycetaceae bacterium]